MTEFPKKVAEAAQEYELGEELAMARERPLPFSRKTYLHENGLVHTIAGQGIAAIISWDEVLFHARETAVQLRLGGELEVLQKWRIRHTLQTRDGNFTFALRTKEGLLAAEATGLTLGGLDRKSHQLRTADQEITEKIARAQSLRAKDLLKVGDAYFGSITATETGVKNNRLTIPWGRARLCEEEPSIPSREILYTDRVIIRPGWHLLDIERQNRPTVLAAANLYNARALAMLCFERFGEETKETA